MLFFGQVHFAKKDVGADRVPFRAEIFAPIAPVRAGADELAVCSDVIPLPRADEPLIMAMGACQCPARECTCSLDRKGAVPAESPIAAGPEHEASSDEGDDDNEDEEDEEDEEDAQHNSLQVHCAFSYHFLMNRSPSGVRYEHKQRCRIG